MLPQVLSEFIFGHESSMDNVSQCTRSLRALFLTLHIHKPVLLKDSTATNA